MSTDSYLWSLFLYTVLPAFFGMLTFGLLATWFFRWLDPFSESFYQNLKNYRASHPKKFQAWSIGITFFFIVAIALVVVSADRLFSLHILIEKSLLFGSLGAGLSLRNEIEARSKPERTVDRPSPVT